MVTPAIAYLRTSSAENVGGDSQHRQREDIEREVLAKSRIRVAKGHRIKPLEVGVPRRRLARGREQAKQGRRAKHQQPPRNPVAERANQLGQIDLGHLLGAAHDMEPLALLAQAQRDKAAGANRDAESTGRTLPANMS